MAGRYATNTDVSSDRSRAEIESTLRRYGANGFMAHLVLPNGQTVAEAAGEQIRTAFETGVVPQLLPDYGRPALPSGGK